MDQHQKGTAYTIKDHQLKGVQADVTDTDAYLQETNETETTLPNTPLSAIIKQYNKVTGSHKQSVLTQTYIASKQCLIMI